MADTPLLTGNGVPVAPPELVITVRQTRMPKLDGPFDVQTQVQTNLAHTAGVWQTVTQILLQAVQGAIEADVRERLAAQNRQIQVPMLTVPGVPLL